MTDFPPPSGPPAGGPGGPPPGQPPPPSYPPPGGGSGGSGPGGAAKGVVIALTVAGVLALLVVAAALVIILVAGGDEDDPSDDTRGSQESTTAAAQTSTGEPTDPSQPTDGSESAAGTDDPSPTVTDASGPTTSADARAEGPAEVLDAFIDAYFSGDCATADALATEDFIDNEGSCDADDVDPELFGDIEWDVKKAVVADDGESAVVPVTLTFDGESETGKFELVLDDGLWKVDKAPD